MLLLTEIKYGIGTGCKAFTATVVKITQKKLQKLKWDNTKKCTGIHITNQQ
jgi:hypothetical protein